MHHTLSATGVWLFLFASELLATGLHSSASILPSARSTLRRYAILLWHSPMLVQFFLHFLASTQLPLLLLSAPTTAPRLLSTATKTPPKSVISILTACSFNGDSCCISCEPPSFLHVFLPQSVLDSKEDVTLSFVSSHVLRLYTPR